MRQTVLGVFVGLILAGVGVFWWEGRAQVEQNAPPPPEVEEVVEEVSEELLDADIRILQSQQLQRAMPVVIGGHLAAAGMIMFFDWQAVIGSYAYVPMMFLMVLLVWGTWSHFERSFDFAAPMWSRDSSMDIALPIWPAKLLAPIAFGSLCLRLCLQLWAYGRAVMTGNAIAVPLIPDAAQQTQMEADQLKDQN